MGRRNRNALGGPPALRCRLKKDSQRESHHRPGTRLPLGFVRARRLLEKRYLLGGRIARSGGRCRDGYARRRANCGASGGFGRRVFGATVGAFEPGKPILRRDFIRWLVKANKALWSDTPGKQVHTADSTEQSTFPDVASSDPDFPYVQGMQDAGYSVGFPDKMFRPNSAK